MPEQPSTNMLKNEIIAVLRLLHDDARVFEWGAGQSTILFAQWCAALHSVESCADWFIKVQHKLVTKNVEWTITDDEKLVAICKSFLIYRLYQRKGVICSLA
jgi:hypothetical protein